MTVAKVFLNNRSQAVRMPAEARFDESVKSVNVRIVGKERILSPIDTTWDSFFYSESGVSDDFMQQRASQDQPEREGFDD